MFRRAVAVSLSSLIALTPVVAVGAPSVGSVEGTVTVSGRPLSGIDVALVDVRSGEVHRAKSGKDGVYRMSLAPGEYVLANGGQAGLSVGRAPSVLNVSAGRVASADVDLLPVAVPTQAPGAASGASAIQYNPPIGCLVAGQFPLIDAVIEPMSSVARARVYFKSALGSDFYYVEMVASEGKFVGKLPRPTMAASPITIHIEATMTDFGESRTADTLADVVPDAASCPDGKRLAELGPAGAVTVFSASTGAAVSVIGGFASTAFAVAGGTVALVVAAAATVAGVINGQTQPTPPPATTPTTTLAPVTTTTTTPPPTTTTTTTLPPPGPPSSPFRE